MKALQLTAAICSQLLLFLDEGLDTVIHILDKVDLVSAESSQVRDIENTIIRLGVLTVDTSDLYVVLVSDGLHKRFVLHELWKVDVHRCSQTSTHVGWAGGDVTEVLVIGEFGLLFDLTSGDGKSLENLKDVRSLLHGNDSELILFVNPHKESLGIVVEDTSVLWPLSFKTSRFKILVTTLEEEMISDELLSLGIGHVLKGVVLTLKITSKLVKSGNDELLDLSSLGWGDAGTEWVGGQVSGNSNSSGVDHSVLIWWEWWAFKGVVVHG